MRSSSARRKCTSRLAPSDCWHAHDGCDRCACKNCARTPVRSGALTRDPFPVLAGAKRSRGRARRHELTVVRKARAGLRVLASLWIGPTSAPGLARAGTPTSAAHGQRRARRRGCRRSRMRARRQTCAAGSGRCTCRTVRRQKQEKCRRKTRLQRAIWVFRTVACRSCELA